MSTLKWTTEPPKVPGWYWVKKDANFSICRVYGSSDSLIINAPLKGWLRVDNCGFVDAWSGPIPEPEE